MKITHSVIYCFVGQVPLTLINIPWSVYSTFVIEQKFGFNKQTPALFVKDLAITQVLTIVIGAPILAAFLKIVDYFGKRSLAFYVMVFLVTVQIVMIALYPTLIQPLFNKLEPLQEGEVKTKTEDLCRKLKFPLGKLWVIDGSKRSAHSNAYFYGLPWSKQIVIQLFLSQKTVD
jgi:STE24 endopeptidase